MHLERTPFPTEPADGAWILRDGRRLLSFSGNDYLGLGRHPAVRAAAIDAVERLGAGSGASPLVTGYQSLAARLEETLARFLGCEAACLFSSGYLANLGAISALVNASDGIYLDELAHASMWAGARMSGAHIASFRHNDPADLERLLMQGRAGVRHALVLTEGVFSMDGDAAPLAALSSLAARFDAWLFLDDAHGLGTRGEGAGSARAFVPATEPDVHVGTLSKALGSSGGFVCGSRPLVALLRNRARGYIYSTAPAPAAIAAALAALDIVIDESQRAPTQSRLIDTPRERARTFARRIGLPEPESHIVPLVIGDAGTALAASARLESMGFLVTAIRPPSVPEGTARLRCSFGAAHTERDAEALADAVRALDVGLASAR